MKFSIELLKKEQECYSDSKKLLKEAKKWKEKKDGLIINNKFLEPTDVLGLAKSCRDSAELYRKAAEECRKAEKLHYLCNIFDEEKEWNKEYDISISAKKYALD